MRLYAQMEIIRTNIFNHSRVVHLQSFSHVLKVEGQGLVSGRW